MSSLDEYSAFREQLYSGGSGGQIVIGTPDEKVRRRGLIIGIIIMIVVIILLVLFFLAREEKENHYVFWKYRYHRNHRINWNHSN